MMDHLKRSVWCSALVIVLAASVSWGFHTGAPEQACDNMTPQHGPAPQTGKSPYRVMIQNKEVAAGQPVDIILTAASSGPPFKGFLIQIHPRNGDQAVGEFNPSSDDNAQGLACGGKQNSAMTHKDLVPKAQVKLQWTPPGDGEYVPVVTWVKQQDTFWVREMADDQIIKVSGGGGGGGAGASPDAKQEGTGGSSSPDANKNASGSPPSGEAPGQGQNHAASSLNSIPTWISSMIFLFSGTVLMHNVL